MPPPFSLNFPRSLMSHNFLRLNLYETEIISLSNLSESFLSWDMQFDARREHLPLFKSPYVPVAQTNPKTQGDANNTHCSDLLLFTSFNLYHHSSRHQHRQDREFPRGSNGSPSGIATPAPFHPVCHALANSVTQSKPSPLAFSPPSAQNGTKSTMAHSSPAGSPISWDKNLLFPIGAAMH